MATLATLITVLALAGAVASWIAGAVFFARTLAAIVAWARSCRRVHPSAIAVPPSGVGARCHE